MKNECCRLTRKTAILLIAAALSVEYRCTNESCAAETRVVRQRIGIMGTGTNFFRCGIAHSSGKVFLGTYGPAPAILWKYDAESGELVKVGAPGEYQLDTMVEAPNGKVYIGTAYGGLVYRLEPHSNKVISLGSPAIDSTPWIFTMTRTQGGEVFGAKGVGLFRLDWREDTLKPIGSVPGAHRTLGRNTSSPIIRLLCEAPDGTIYGDTNRWLFRFDPTTGRIEPLADMVRVDPACYCLFLPYGQMPTDDCYFTLYSRFSGEAIKDYFYVYHADKKQVEPLRIESFTGQVNGHPAWWRTGEDARLLTPIWHDEEQRVRLAVVDPFARRVVDEWEVDDNVDALIPLPGPGLHYASVCRGRLLKADPAKRRLVTLAENPVAIRCRCLAISPQRVLGTDSYDCGHAFTLDLKSAERRDHGKVWQDDHRCNYGPAAFAGTEGRYFLANHSEGMPALWVTDTRTDLHRQVGPSAIQLVAMRDGTVWGTTGPNPAGIRFDPRRCWVPGWQARFGSVFRYRPGQRQVDTISALSPAGPIVEAPGSLGLVIAAREAVLCVYDPEAEKIVQEIPLPGKALAAAHEAGQDAAYFVLEGSLLYACRKQRDTWKLTQVAADFGPVDRGFFTLPRTGRVLGVAADGMVTVYHLDSNKVTKMQGPPPEPTGPAVDLENDAWYFADDGVFRYTLDEQP